MTGFLPIGTEGSPMGARPPQNETSEPDVIEFGIAALAARLEEASIEYPVTEAGVVTAVEDTEIPIDSAGNTVALSTALERLPQSEFHSQSDLLDQLHPVFEAERRNAANSVVGRLRALLPF